MAAAFAARIRHREAVTDSTTLWLVEYARSSLSRIHPAAALSNRSPRSRVDASRNSSLASSRRPAAANDVICFARSSQSLY